MATLEEEKPEQFVISGKPLFGRGPTKELVFKRVGTKGAVYVAKLDQELTRVPDGRS